MPVFAYFHLAEAKEKVMMISPLQLQEYPWPAALRSGLTVAGTTAPGGSSTWT
jgi:hypothetical protein